MAVNKIDLLNMLNEQLSIPKKDSGNIIESFFAIIKDELCQGNDVVISRFGKWKAKAKKKRRGRNPQTGKEMTINARRVVTFKPSPVLKGAINAEK
ncbi:MAG: HU family DNA-binding protein [Deltaproteobacteria bacterium]|nr:HU family DNA-binding protein [Deltaproteobacteria bacterium]